MKVERRAAAQRAEMNKDDTAVRVIGHAAVFNQEADIGGYFREVLRPGCFRNSIANDDVPFLIEHSGLPLARNTAGTLKLVEDDVGLRMESTLDGADPDVMRIVPKMQRGDLNKMSFGFMATRQEWDETGDTPLRIVHECRLFDVSIVTSPAYDGTDIGLRSLQEWREAHRAPLIFGPVRSLGARLRMRHKLFERGIRAQGEEMMTAFKVGDRVRVKSGKAHDEETAEKTGTIKEIATQALGIAFDDMGGVHRWYVDEEVEAAD